MLRSNDLQRASCKEKSESACSRLVLALCASCPPLYYPGAAHVFTLLSPCAHHVPQYTTQAQRAETAAYAIGGRPRHTLRSHDCQRATFEVARDRPRPRRTPSTVRHTAPKKSIKQYWILQTPSSQTSSARTADPKPDLNALSEVYVERRGTVFLGLKHKYLLQKAIVFPRLNP